MKRTSYRSGLWAESLAALYLTAKGYRILARRYRTPLGEIDLVAKRGRVVAFVEVKARPSHEAGLFAVSQAAQGRIARAARHYISGHPRYVDHDLRFDIVTVVPPCRVRHLDNAWTPAA